MDLSQDAQLRVNAEYFVAHLVDSDVNISLSAVMNIYWESK